MATFPITPIPSNVSLKSIVQVYSSMMQNFSVEKKSNGAQRWEITLDYGTLDSIEGKSLFSFIMGRRGSLDTFDFQLPVPLNNTTGSYTSGTITLASGSNIIGSSITVDGLPANGTGTLKAGDMVQFSNHNKVYMLTADVTGTGTADAATFIPPVHVDLVAGTTTLSVDSVIFKMSLIDKDQEFALDENVYYSLSSLKMVETFNVPVNTV